MSVYKNLFVYTILVLFLSACSVLQPRKQTVYNTSDKAEAVEVDMDSNGAIDIVYGGTNSITAATALSNLGGLRIAATGSDSVVHTYSDGSKTFNVSLETPDHINNDSALSFGVQSSPLKFYLADDPTLGGTRAYLWSTSVTLPMLPHTGIRPTFAVYGDVLIGDIIALESNPMTYFMRVNTGLSYTAVTQLFSAKFSTKDTDGGAVIGLSPLQNAGGAVSDGNISIVAYGKGTGAEGNSVTLANRDGVDTAAGRWLMDGQSASKGDWRPMAADTYSIGTDDYPVKRIRVNEVAVTNTVKWTAGSGSPEGSVTAPIGSLYSRIDGGTGTSLYVKESGTGNTGWAPK